MNRIWLKIGALFGKRRLDAEMEEELRFHLDAQIEENIAAGMSPGEARRVALRDFGGLEQTKEAHRDARGIAWLESLWQDVRFAVRSLRRSPGFTVIAVLTLALGVGANTAIFSVVDEMLLRDLPVRDPERLYEVLRASRDGARMSGFSMPAFEAFGRETESFSEMFGFTDRTLAMEAGGAPEQVLAFFVTGNYFTALGATARYGRTILPNDDDRIEPSPVAVLSDAFWRRRFGGDPAVVGSTVHLNGFPVSVVGVMPETFVGVNRLEQPEITVPMSLAPKVKWGFLDAEFHSIAVRVVGRLKPGVEPEQAAAELQGPFRTYHLEAARGYIDHWPEDDRAALLSERVDLEPARHGTFDIRNHLAEAVRLLALVVGAILLLACANLAGLLMTRGLARGREMGIRTAVGASRGRLMRFCLTESVLLAFAGGAAGLLVALWLHRLLVSFVKIDATYAALDLHIDGRLLGLTFLVSCLAALLFGVLPAALASNARPFIALKGSWSGGSNGPRRTPARLLLTAQVAISIVLLVSAGLFLRTLDNLYRSDAGFDRSSLLLASIDTTNSQTKNAWNMATSELLERTAAIPGVTSVAFADIDVFGNSEWRKTIWVDGYEYAPGESHYLAINTVGPGFFKTAGIILLQGREFTANDRPDTQPVAIVNRTMAEKYFPNGNAIGRRFGDSSPSSSRKYEIVGIVGNARYSSLRESPQPIAYLARLQDRRHSRNICVHIRSSVPVDTLALRVRELVAEIDPGLVVYSVQTLEETVDRSLSEERMMAVWTSLFAGVALLLICIGLYGMTAHGVERRTNEIGLRVALGAKGEDVVRLVLAEALQTLVAGGAIGIGLAIIAGRLIEARLFGLSAADPLAFAGAAAALVMATALACYRPARRALRVDPARALRCE